jgi:hypothetical protein
VKSSGAIVMQHDMGSLERHSDLSHNLTNIAGVTRLNMSMLGLLWASGSSPKLMRSLL